MKSNYFKSIFLLIFLAILIVQGACKKSENTSDPDPENELKFIHEYVVNNHDMEINFAELPEDPAVYGYLDLYNDLLLNSDTLMEEHTFSKVTYTSIDNEGNPISLSGLLIYPSNGIHDNTPLISHNHGTELEKKYAPSQFVLGQSDITKFEEVMIAWGISAMNNWVVIMPDYQGMGEDVGEVHPFCIKERLANATADMLVSAQNTIKNQWNPSWQGNTYIMGYSEGGFVTMAALQELEKRNVELNGALCMEGPYDLSGAMRNVLLSDTAFPVPYFLPMMLVSYQHLYPDIFIYDEMLIDPYKTDIPKYTTGFYSVDQVNSIMPSDQILEEVFTDAFIDSLNTTGSRALQTLYNNNTYVGWTPSTKTFIWHCVNDDCVPFGNFEKVKNAFGTPPNISYTEYPPIQPVFHTIHETAAPIAFLQGATWILEQEKE